MFVFIAITGISVAVSMVFLLPPLLRWQHVSAGNSGPDFSLAIYRDQFRELEVDLRSGALTPARFEESKRELEQRLLTDVPHATALTRTIAVPSRRLALALAVAVPLGAALLYAYLGTPRGIHAPNDTPNAEARGAPHELTPDQIERMVARLAQRLAADPSDAVGWAMLARSYVALGRHAEAVHAFSKALPMLPNDAQLLADYADALAMTSGGRLDGEPMKLVRRALKADPGNVKALALAGTAAFEKKDYRAAVGYWQRGVQAAGNDHEFSASLKASLAEANALAAGKLPVSAVEENLSQARLPVAGAEGTGAVARVAGHVTLAPELARQASPNDRVFVFARAAQGPKMPLAMLTRQVKDLPLDFVLDDSSSMTPAMKLSSVDSVVLVARISKSGTAEVHPGDLQGVSDPIPVGTSGAQVKIDQTLR